MRACWLKWVGRDWSISADYIWLNYSGANTQDEDGTFALNPVAIILFAALVVVCGVVSFFILRVRKTSRRSVAPAATVDYAAFRSAASQGDSSAWAQVHPPQTSVPIDCPRFCGSCGGPLVPGTRFCPHCGAPVKH